MKRTLPRHRILLCLAAILLAALLAGGACKKKPAPAPAKPRTMAPRVPTTTLSLNYGKGKKQKCELMTRYDIVTADEKLKDKTLLPLHSANVMDWDITQDKNVSIKMTLNKTAVNAVNTDGEAAAADIVGALNTQPAEITLDVALDGTLNGAQGLDERLTAIDQQGGTKRIKKDIAALLRRQMAFESINNLTTLMFSLTPADARASRKAGDVWGGKSYAFSLFGTTDTVSVDLKFKLSEFDKKDKNLAYILFGGEKQFDPDEMQADAALSGLLDAGAGAAYQVLGVKVKGYIVYNMKDLDIEEIKQEITINTTLTRKKESTDVAFVQTSVLNLL